MITMIAENDFAVLLAVRIFQKHPIRKVQNLI
jgi:hypothetical protein